jgi:enoyl-CoA hydratase/carnithine racemase
MRRAPQPIIAAVNGAAVGAGLSLALAADIRLGAPTARFACSYLNLGLGGGEQGSTYHLVRLVGSANTARMMYTGGLIGAEEALAMGLLSKLVPDADLLPAAIELAEEMCSRSSPLALRLSKETLNEVLGGLPLEGTIRFESRSQLLCRDTKDAIEARAAWAEKRSPAWIDG